MGCFLPPLRPPLTPWAQDKVNHPLRLMETPPSLPSDPLVALQLQVARRADELAAARAVHTAFNLPCWLQAEQEILGNVGMDPIAAGDHRAEPAANRNR